MFPFRRVEIHARGYDSSRGPEVKASSGRPAVTCRLLNLRSVFLAVYVDIGHRNDLRCSFFNSLTISCIDSTTQSDAVSVDCHQAIKAIPRARKIPVAGSFPSASGDMNV